MKRGDDERREREREWGGIKEAKMGGKGERWGGGREGEGERGSGE